MSDVQSFEHLLGTTILTKSIAKEIDECVQSEFFTTIAKIPKENRTDAWFYTMAKHFKNRVNKKEIALYLCHFSNPNIYNTYRIWLANLRHNLVECSHIDVEIDIPNDFVTQEAIGLVTTLVEHVFNKESIEYDNKPPPVYIYGLIHETKSHRQLAIERIIDIAQQKNLNYTKLVQTVLFHQVFTFCGTHRFILSIADKKFLSAEILCMRDCVETPAIDIITNRFVDSELYQMFVNTPDEPKSREIITYFLGSNVLYNLISTDEICKLDSIAVSAYTHQPHISAKILMLCRNSEYIYSGKVDDEMAYFADMYNLSRSKTQFEITLARLYNMLVRPMNERNVDFMMFLYDVHKTLYTTSFSICLRNERKIDYFDISNPRNFGDFVELHSNEKICRHAIDFDPKNIKYAICSNKQFYLDFVQIYPNYIKHINHINNEALREIISNDPSFVNMLPNMNKYINEYIYDNPHLVKIYKNATIAHWKLACTRDSSLLLYLYNNRRGLFANVVRVMDSFGKHNFNAIFIRQIAQYNDRILTSIPVNDVNISMCKMITRVETLTAMHLELLKTVAIEWLGTNIDNILLPGYTPK